MLDKNSPVERKCGGGDRTRGYSYGEPWSRHWAGEALAGKLLTWCLQKTCSKQPCQVLRECRLYPGDPDIGVIGAGVVAYPVKQLPPMPASTMDTDLRPGCPAADLTSC